MLDECSLDFYLEDDMFEIEGYAHVDDGRIVVDVRDAVGHILAIAGEKLEVFMGDKALHAKRMDNGKVFQMEINRIYKKYINPMWQDVLSLKSTGKADHFFQKESDTLIWFEQEENLWYIELNKINMFFSGHRKSYGTVKQLFGDNEEIVKGVWQAVSYSSEVEYEEKDYDEYSDRVRIQKI